jgi:hypothetical protein
LSYYQLETVGSALLNEQVGYGVVWYGTVRSGKVIS